jgi:hypothetical protein
VPIPQNSYAEFLTPKTQNVAVLGTFKEEIKVKISGVDTNPISLVFLSEEIRTQTHNTGKTLEDSARYHLPARGLQRETTLISDFQSQ